MFVDEVEEQEFIKLLDALEITTEISDDVVGKMKKWPKLEKVPPDDIKNLKKWVKEPKPNDHPHKIGRCLMWYIVKKIDIPEFPQMEIKVTIRKTSR